MTRQPGEILVIEDSPTQRQRLTHILEGEGYSVLPAADGAAALELLASRKPALVISDVIMPGIDGYTLCRRIKEDPHLADIPVILVTYLSHPHDVLRGLEAGADNFIMKPYEDDFFLARVRRTLAAAPAEAPQPPPEFPLEVEGEHFCIRSGSRQMLEILLSTYETALRKNDRLKAAQEELRATNQELEAFSYSVSHDLRAPLSVITGFGELLWLDFGGQLGEQGRDHIRMIRRSAEKMGKLIDDLLMLSRATRAEIRTERIDLTAMLREIAADLHTEEPAREVDCLITEGMTITGDAALLRIAFDNLLRNAWKFTAKKERARIEAGWRPGAETVYYVRDNGAGFDMREAGQAFRGFPAAPCGSGFPRHRPRPGDRPAHRRPPQGAHLGRRKG